MRVPERTIRLAEIYATLHGEMPYQGKPCVVIRLAGCSTRCSWCDTRRWWKRDDGEPVSVDDIISRLRPHGIKELLLTGGEPLEQEASIDLMRSLVRSGFRITLETDGTHSLRRVPRAVTMVVDLKTPSSKVGARPIFKEYKLLKKGDVLKVPVADERDYIWAKRILDRYGNRIKCMVVFSCVHGKLSPGRLARLLIADGSRYRMQIQLHKLLGLR